MELQGWTQRRNETYLMRVLNKKYWPHQVKINNNFDEAERWCYDNLKSCNWRNVGTHYAFKKGDEATMFALKWTT